MNIRKIMGRFAGGHKAALVTSPVSRRYLTGFSADDGGILLVTAEKGYFVTDSRYYEHAKDQVDDPDCEVRLMEKYFLDDVAGIAAEQGINEIFLENDDITLSQMENVKGKFPAASFDCTSALSDFIKNMRIVKTDYEIECVTKAQRIAEAAFTKLLSNMKAGQTEKQIAAILEFFMMDFGADGISFSTIAASGINSACPHAVPSEKKVEEGDFLTLDFGAMYKGYHSDMTRTVVFGKPTEEMKNVYNAVWGANNDAIKALRADISCKVVDSVARSTLDAWGYEKYFNHGLGHGVGLEIHEEPSLGKRSGTMLKEGMIVTIEPGIYIPGKYGVRIEDMCAITKDGCKIITETPKTLIYI